MTQRRWDTWVRKHPDARRGIVIGVLGMFLMPYLVITSLQRDLTRLWVDPLFAQDGVVTTATIVTVVSEPEGRSNLAELIIRYQARSTADDRQVERKLLLDGSAYRILRTRGATTLPIQYLPTHPTVARPVDVAPDGTLRDRTSQVLPPPLVSLVTLGGVVGIIFMIFTDVMPVLRPTMSAARRGQRMRQAMAGVLVGLILFTGLLAEPWNPTPWLDRCHLPQPPFGLTSC